MSELLPFKLPDRLPRAMKLRDGCSADLTPAERATAHIRAEKVSRIESVRAAMLEARAKAEAAAEAARIKNCENCGRQHRHTRGLNTCSSTCTRALWRKSKKTKL